LDVRRRGRSRGIIQALVRRAVPDIPDREKLPGEGRAATFGLDGKHDLEYKD
jgi:hypothetical protein